MADKISDFVFSGYEVNPTMNGGFIVRQNIGPHEFRDPLSMASFTNRQDLFAWLKEAHEQFEKEYSSGGKKPTTPIKETGR